MMNTSHSWCWPPRFLTGHRSTGVGCLLLAGLLSACATTGGLLPPDVTLVNVHLVEATLFESTFDVEVRITNDNPEPLVVDGAVIKLELNGKKFGRGASPERLEIPRMDSAVLQLKMNLSHVAIATKIRGVIENQVVNYSVYGYVYVVTPSGGTKRLRVDKEGIIDLSGGISPELIEEAVAAEAVES